MDKAVLLAAPCPKARVVIPVWVYDDQAAAVVERQAEVIVRGLTRQEWMNVGKISGQNPDIDAITRSEAFTLAAAMVDPALTLDEAREWLKIAPSATIDAVMDKIMTLTGVRKEQAKEAYKSV